jgi:hypothetical protein
LKRISPDILYHLTVAILLFLWTSSFEAGNLPFLTLDDLAWCSRWRCLLPSDILALRREGLEEWREFMVLIRHGGKIMNQRIVFLRNNGKLRRSLQSLHQISTAASIAATQDVS